jgi:hypothetical protein
VVGVIVSIINKNDLIIDSELARVFPESTVAGQDVRGTA